MVSGRRWERQRTLSWIRGDRLLWSTAVLTQKVRRTHRAPWMNMYPVPVWEAKQAVISSRVAEVDRFLQPPKLIGGADISFDKNDPLRAAATVVVCEYPSMKVIREETEVISSHLPYVPGFLAFREAPPVLSLLQRFIGDGLRPDVLFCDGNGVLHPRRCGLATFLGVVADLPTVGCAKTLYSIDGLHEYAVRQKIADLKLKTGQNLDLVGDSGRLWGKALLSSAGSQKPIYISVGHRVSLDTAVGLVLECSKHRVPEPVRHADHLSRQALK